MVQATFVPSVDILLPVASSHAALLARIQTHLDKIRSKKNQIKNQIRKNQTPNNQCTGPLTRCQRDSSSHAMPTPHPTVTKSISPSSGMGFIRGTAELASELTPPILICPLKSYSAQPRRAAPFFYIPLTGLAVAALPRHKQMRW